MHTKVEAGKAAEMGFGTGCIKGMRGTGCFTAIPGAKICGAIMGWLKTALFLAILEPSLGDQLVDN